MTKKITIERLMESLSYDPETGIFVWKIGRRVGKNAGSKYGTGYLIIYLDEERIPAHRLAWMYVHGALPSKNIDHINRIRSDNRIENLREASQAENCQNISLRANSRTGYMGVGFHKVAKKYWARIMLNGERFILGHFETPEEASTAYLSAKAKLHKFHPTVT